MEARKGMTVEIQAGPAPLDLKPQLAICDCEFTPYADGDPEESWHYLRQCLFCGHRWYGLHCPHDGYQNPCGKCGQRPVPVTETEIR